MWDWLSIIIGILDLGGLQGLVFCGLGFSVVLSLLTLDFPDLSIEGTFPLGAAIAAVFIHYNIYPALALLFAGMAGACGGLLTGIFHVRFKMSKLLSGICTAAIFYSLNMWIMGNKSNLPILDKLTLLSWFEAKDAVIKELFFPSNSMFYHPATIIACLLIVLVMKFILDGLLISEFGVILRSVGQNEEAARYNGRNPGHYKLAGLALANTAAAVSGAVAAQYQGFSDVNMGVGVLILGLVAVIFGQEIYARLGFRLSSPSSLTCAALLGSVLYQVILAGVLRAGVPPTALRLCTGISLVALIAIRQRRREVTFS